MVFWRDTEMLKTQTLLLLDSGVNLLLGTLLLLFPASLVEFLGVPDTDLAFYPSILGAVLIGIGIALLIERHGESRGWRGLGLEGAISINLIGAVVLAAWLLRGELAIAVQGYVFLWILVVLLAGISGVELLARRARREGAKAS